MDLESTSLKLDERPAVACRLPDEPLKRDGSIERDWSIEGSTPDLAAASPVKDSEKPLLDPSPGMPVHDDGGHGRGSPAAHRA